MLSTMERYNGTSQYIYYKIGSINCANANKSYDITSLGFNSVGDILATGSLTQIYNIASNSNPDSKFFSGTPYGVVLNYEDTSNTKLSSVELNTGITLKSNRIVKSPSTFVITLLSLTSPFLVNILLKISIQRHLWKKRA